MDSIRRKLVWLVASRAALLVALIAITLLLGRNSPYIGAVTLLALVVALLSLIYAAALQANVSPKILIPLQLGNDIILVTWLTARTGDIESPFKVLYLVVIFAASLLSSRRGILIITLFAIALWTLLSGAVLLEFLPRAEGFPRYVDNAITPIQFQFALTIVAILGVSILSMHLAERQTKSDTQLADATRRLAELRAFNERIIESMRSGLITAGLDGRIVTFNRAAEEITLFPAASVVGRPLSDLFGQSIEMAFEDPEDHRTVNVLRSDIIFDRPDGTSVSLGFNVAPLTDEDGYVQGMVLIFQDLTDVFELEQEVRRQEKLAALGAMAAGLAHEIRNPLASLRGSVQVLSSDLVLDEDQERLMQILLRESDRLNRTVTDFLAFARPAPTNSSEFDLKRAVADAVTLLRNSPEVSDQHEIVERYPDGEVVFFGDPNQIRQIFWNLARNGLQAMPAGGQLEISLERATDGSSRLVIEDEGVGMDDEQLGRLFEPFYSSRNGTGLGMAIVYQLVNEHGGRIVVDSRPGEGTRLEVILPKREPEVHTSPSGELAALAVDPGEKGS